MRVAGIRVVGAPVEMIDVADPRPLEPDEVLVEVKAAGVGNWNEFVRTGGWDVGGVPPMALGVEAAGIVLEVGEAIEEWTSGDAVMTHPLPLRHQGTWAPQLIAPGGLLAPKPENVSWDAASAFPVPALTAEQVVAEALDIQAGEPVLVNGASGVTGRLIVALAALRGAEVIATASPSSRVRVAQLGARHIVDYHDADWTNQVRAITGQRGVAAAANAAPGGAATALRAVADGGRLATITGDPPEQERGVTIANFYVRPDGQQLRALAKPFGDGRLDVVVASTYRLDSAAQALAEATGGHAAGAIALVL